MVVAISFVESALAFSWFAIVLLSFGLAGLLRQVRALADGQIATQAPTPGPALGANLARDFPTHDRLTGILFMSDGCSTCDMIQAKVPSLLRASSVELTMYIVTTGSPKSWAGDGVHIMPDGEKLFQKYRVSSTPFGVMLEPDGRVVLSGPVGSVEALDDLVMFTRSPEVSE